ncbi:Multidrug resistance-associated protein 1 [Toxocara canis]|uniref:ABC-type glutathione-S-conjugate transporter n=1 Tax=Toxocara canis TaxID=6265 RepID=A0A0B2UML2_TOXCA|nr:Multidrug resistance-associated protein 1 [Toxocara canis]
MDAIARQFCAVDHFELLELGRNATVPHISECVQSSLLTLLPCIFLFISCPLVLYQLSKSDNGPLECCSPTIARIIFCVFLSCMSAISFFYGLYEWKTGPSRKPFLSLLPISVQYLALCVALVLMIACRNRGIVTSGVLFNYWLLFAVCSFPEFRWRIEAAFIDGIERFDNARFALCIISYPLVLLEVLLSCFADTPRYKIDDKSLCPEKSCSFLNQITFNWFHGLAVKGNKQTLQISDLWKLNPCDESRNLVPAFSKNWRPALQAFYERKRAAMQQSPPRILTQKEMPSVLWPLFRTYYLPFLGGAALKFLFDLLQFVAPQLLSMLISFTENKSQPLWIGIAISLSMFFVALFQSFILHQYFHTMFSLGMNIRSVLTSTVYAKALALSNSARKNRTVGEIVNLMSVDIQRIQDMTSFVMLFWSAPLQVILSIYFLWRLLGISVIAGLFILVAMIPFNSWISVKMRSCQVEQMKHKDERLKLMSEILNGIKVLKLYAWEKSMQRIILEIRQKEILVLRRLAFYNAVITLSWSCAPFLVAVLTFGVYVNIDPLNNVLTPQVTFVGLSLFNILRFPMAVFAMIFSQAVQCAVSNGRLKSFLADEEMDPFVTEGSSACGAVVIKGGNFSWDSSELTLKDINLNIKKGELVAVVGSVGSGKSSLLSAMLGEMDRQSGEVAISGSVAYVPQQAWIQNMSLRDNITFNKSYVPEFYDTVIDACALGPDLATLPAGDSTEIGEKGINLSGGQKQRVSLARAVYSDSDIMLLDDPLSAVDAHVGKHIFEHVIATNGGLLAGKTRILVTHGLHYLRRCDQVIVMKDGTISEIGTYEQLMASEGAFADFLEEFLLEEAHNRARSVSFGEQTEEVDEVLKELERFAPAKSRRIQSQMSSATRSSQESLEQRSRTASPSSPSSPSAHEKGLDMVMLARQMSNGGTPTEKEREGMGAKERLLDDSKPAPPSVDEKSKLIEKEAVEIGKVKWTVYLAYIKAIGYVITVLFLSIYVVSSILGVLSNLWLANWSDHAKRMNSSSPEEQDTNVRLAIYASLGMGQATFVCVASVVMALGMVHASRSLHEGIVRNILRSPMHFFDVTPIGRILNRFGKDVNIVDTELPESVGEFLCSVQEVIVTLAIIVAILPQTLWPFCICAVIFSLFLDVEVVDTSLPHCSRSFIATALNVLVTVVVILYATPAFSAVIPVLTFVYYLVLDVEMLDTRLPSSLMTVIGCIVQGSCILLIPVVVTPEAGVFFAAISVFYFYLLEMEGVDMSIPRAVVAFVRTAVSSLEILVVIAFVTPHFPAVTVPIALIYFVLLRFYVSTSRQLKRLESTTRSPIYSHFQESVQGAASIRAYRCVDRFVNESQKRVDDNLVTYYPSIVANRWLAVRLELIGNLIVLCSAVFAVFYRDSGAVTAGLVGLSVSYALNITQTLNWAVRMTSELETNIVAVERIKEYTESPTEGSPNESLLRKPTGDWPTEGEIQIENLDLRYRENLGYVLRNVNAHIKGGEKIGIVGRTGAGKSSLTLALFRIVEAERGRILIDGEDISKMPLEVLRSRLTVVPQWKRNLKEANMQRAVWFDSNCYLHMFACSRTEVCRCLDKCTWSCWLKNGNVRYVGQRQLICLARALLRKTKVLILDEAAASVDLETDALIQKTIREQFAACTVLTIAHRLHTVIDSDRLLVLEAGQVKEFDSPKRLLEDRKSLFYSMAKESGITTLLVLEAGQVKEFDSPKRLLEDRKSLFYSMAKESGITT